MLRKKAGTVHRSSWCSKKYCFRHLFAKTYFELNIWYPRMLKKYLITVFDPSVEFSRYSLLYLGEGINFLSYHVFVHEVKWVLWLGVLNET